MTKTGYVLAAALMLGGCFAAAAQNAPDAGQTPPKAEPPPVADKGTTVQENCIVENDGYARRGGKPMFVIQLENKCEQRLVCKVYAYVTSARGVVQGRGTIKLAAKSESSFTMPAKMMGGSSQSDRECRPY
jgi:hypothetical protein